MWSMNPNSKKRPTPVRMADIFKSQSSISTVAYSPKYRVSPSHLYIIIFSQLYLVVTNCFKFIFLNELNRVVNPPIDMNQLRLVTHAHFLDERDKLITAGLKGVYIFNFEY